jgi:integrase
MAAKLTQIAVENAKPKKGVDGKLVRNEIPDRGCPGLFLIVQPSRAKSWALRYRVGGKSRKLTLGTAADAATPGALTLAAARAAAAKAQHEVALGTDPAASKQAALVASAQQAALASADDIEGVVTQFIELHAKRRTRPASVQATESIFRRLVLPEWRGKTIHDIRRRDVIALVEAIAADRPVMANRTLAAVSKFFNWLVARDMIAASPARGVERPAPEVARERILDDSEVAALWLASGDPELGLAGPLVKLMLLTGCRRGEVAGMRWSEIDTAARVWTIPASRSKNKHAHTVPLALKAWNVIEALPRTGEFVFGAARGDGHIGGFDDIKLKLDAKLNFAKAWRLHDLRRTCASGLQRLGTRVEVIESALNHRSGGLRGIVGVYQRHDFADERRIALANWANHIEQLATTGKSAKIVRIK